MSKRVLLCAIALLAAVADPRTASGTDLYTCPSVGSATDCTYLFEIGPDLSLTLAATHATLIDTGSIDADDALIGVFNSSGQTVHSIKLMTPPLGNEFLYDIRGIFSLDGDEESSAWADRVFFSNIYGQTVLYPWLEGFCTSQGGPPGCGMVYMPGYAGQVNFVGGLANGAGAYFGLEVGLEAPPLPATPEPAAFLLVATPLAALLAVRRHRRGGV